MEYSVERVIKALAGVEQAKQRKDAETIAERARKAGYLVTVSRGYGSQGNRVAQALAARLGVMHFDRDILEAVAIRAMVDIELVRQLDETVRHEGLKPWLSLFNPAALSEKRYYEGLLKVVMNIAHTGGVIVGRGAHLILGPQRAFRVRIVGSLERCAERIAEREQTSLEMARQRVQQVDQQRKEFHRHVFGVECTENSYYEMILNSDRFSIDQLVNLILTGMSMVGYQLPEKVFRRA